MLATARVPRLPGAKGGFEERDALSLSLSAVAAEAGYLGGGSMAVCCLAGHAHLHPSTASYTSGVVPCHCRVGWMGVDVIWALDPRQSSLLDLLLVN